MNVASFCPPVRFVVLRVPSESKAPNRTSWPLFSNIVRQVLILAVAVRERVVHNCRASRVDAAGSDQKRREKAGCTQLQPFHDPDQAYQMTKGKRLLHP
jgi:hypothetical protein